MSAHFFIHRPVFAMVLSVLVVLGGLLARPPCQSPSTRTSSPRRSS